MFHGRVWRLIDLLESGEMTVLDEELAAFAQLTVALRQPFYQWWVAVFQAMRALLEGRFGEAEHLAHRAAASASACRITPRSSPSCLRNSGSSARSRDASRNSRRSSQAARILPPNIHGARLASHPGLSGQCPGAGGGGQA